MYAEKFLPSAALLLMSAVIAACSTSPQPATTPVGNQQLARPAAGDTTAGFDWSWDIAGDPQIRPIQVFTNGEKTWLQMAPHQVMPAVFVAGLPVPFDLNPPYLMLVGAPDRIDLVATAYRAVVTRRAAAMTGDRNVPPQRSIDTTRIQRVPPSQITQPKE